MRASIIVLDRSSRESSEALPRWLEVLENYVAPEVVKIIVGNKLDNVSNDPRPVLSNSPSPTPYLPTLRSRHHCHLFLSSSFRPTTNRFYSRMYSI